jgi:hypothetical protein
VNCPPPRPLRRTTFRAKPPRALLLAGALLCWGEALQAQAFEPLRLPHAEHTERQRLGELFGDSVAPEGERPSGSWRLIAPELHLVSNSELPYSLNEGALWAGRGLSVRLTAGARVSAGRVTAVIAPHLLHSANEPFEPLPFELRRQAPGRSRFAHFWYDPEVSVDLPWRFGEGAWTGVDPGESSITVRAGRGELGASTARMWWGPGVRNALVLSANAPGIPRIFARTADPLATRWGTFHAEWHAGRLVDSPFFDGASSNGRFLSAAMATYTPAMEPGLTLGMARAVYGPADGAGALITGGLEVFTRWEAAPSIAADTAWLPTSEQILSFFGRWVFPESGVETYAEWARQRLPLSFGDLLAFPNHTQGYTLGLQWAREAPGGRLRLQTEVTTVELSSTFRHRPTPTFYTSEAVPQGYTHRGRVIGAAIGPGSSSQWLALDHFSRSFRAGVYLSRIRWHNDFLHRSVSPQEFRTERSFHANDVSLVRGVRVGAITSLFEVEGEYRLEDRYNFLFQNPDLGWGPEDAVDVRNHGFSLTFRAVPGRR